MSDKKKMGRPTSDLKEIKLTVRVNKDTNDRLEKYCQENNVSKVEGIRIALNRLPLKEEK